MRYSSPQAWNFEVVVQGVGVGVGLGVRVGGG